MAAVRLIYDETTNSITSLGYWGRVSIKGTRKLSKGPLRYCLQDSTLYLPRDNRLIESDHRLAWMRVRTDGVDEDWLDQLGDRLPFNPLIEFRPDIGVGSLYSSRHAELDERRTAVAELCSQTLIDAVDGNPDVLDDVSRRDFERLIAELFARMGFEIELSRQSKDDGIDFLAIRPERVAPIILIVQCKHPDSNKPSSRRRRIGVELMRELYGTAVWNDVRNCIMVTSSKFTAGAQTFAAGKPDQIKLADRSAILRWITKYRHSI